MNYFISTRNIYTCSKCKRQFRVTNGTIFERSKISLVTWFKAIYYFTTHKRGISSCQLSEWLEVRQKTAWFILHRLREALSTEAEHLILDGEVEADETRIGPNVNRDERHKRARKLHNEKMDEIFGLSDKKKRTLRGFPAKPTYQKGMTKEVREKIQKEKEEFRKKYGVKTPYEPYYVVFGMTERKGRVVLKVLGKGQSHINKDKIYPLLKKHITDKSILITDQLNLYDDTINLFKDHKTVNHEEGYVIKGIHTANIDNIWKHFKKVIAGSYFHMSGHLLQTYLNEHTYRWNRRKLSRREQFDQFIPLTIGKRLDYKTLSSINPLKHAA
jgi:hypothetical protein